MSKIHGNGLDKTALRTLSLFVLGVAIFLFVYFFFEVFLLIFGAILVATLISMVEKPLEQRLGLPRWPAVSLAVTILIGVSGGVAYLFGIRLADDLQNVISRMSQAQAVIERDLKGSLLSQMFTSHLGPANIPIAEIATSIFSVSTNALAGLVVAVMAGIYIAAEPSHYLHGFLILFPEKSRNRAEETVQAIAAGLNLWLKGQFISMFLIGVLWLAATWSIGLPSAIALGLIGGFFEFVPYIGPIIAAIPALLVAATQGTDSIIWTLVAYLGIHTLEGNIVAPLIQRRLVYIPPATMLLGIASISIIFGTAAIIFAAPAVVVVFIFVAKLYVRDSLQEETSLPEEVIDQTGKQTAQ